MGTKAYLIITGVLFGIIAVLHLLRLIYQWPLQVGTVNIPIIVSCAGLLVTAVLCVWAFLLVARK
ncbi:MAG: hypothetical protein HY356_01875 [Gammaproteobacteria bacterium]|nr:hypothetical protein [Gammaproteobacteria bacterium]